ncbi:unnamed protein product [Closterium sp. NIES-54]
MRAWLTRDAAARLAIRNHLPLAERTHFKQHKIAKALYNAVVARDSSPATAALGRLLLPYLFPELSAFATVEDLITHLRTTDARYRSALPAEDHFLALDPTDLTVDLLEKHLLAAETSVAAVGAAHGTPRTPFFEGCSLSPLAPFYASSVAFDVLGAEDVGAASAIGGKSRSTKDSGGGGGGSSGGGGGSGGGGSSGSGGRSGGFGGGSGGGGGGGGCGSGASGGSRGGAVQRGGSGNGQRQQQQRQSETPSPQQLCEWFAQRGASGGSVSCPYVIRTCDRTGQTCGKPHTQHRCFSRLDDALRAEFGDDAERPHWGELLRYGVAIFDLDYDAILAAIYALSVSAEGECYLCVPPDPGIEAAALGASESALPGTVPTEALHTFTLDSGASRCFFRDSTTLTPLSAPVPVTLVDPSGGPVLCLSSTVLPSPAVPSGSLSGLHLRSFSTNLVSTAALQDAMVTTTTPGGQRVSICTCTRTGRHLPTFTCRPGSSLYTLATEPPKVYASAQVSASCPVAAPCSCRLLSHQLSFGTTALVTPPCHASVACTPASLFLVFPGLCLPSRPRLPRPAFLASRGGSAPLLTPPRFPRRLLPCRLSTWTGVELSSDLLRDFCRGEGILQLFTLLASPQQNGVAERRIGLVMEVAHTSMIHAAAPHFLWPFAVRYAAHQLNLWPRVSLPETSPTLRWTGKGGDVSVFRVWGSRAFVRDTSADKLSSRAIPCVFLGFPPDASGWQFYHPTLCRVIPSQDVTFVESVPFYRLFPYRSAPLPPSPLFLAPGPPQVDPLPPQDPAPLGVSHVEPLRGTVPVEVAVDSGAARGASSGGAASWGAEPAGVEPRGADSEGAKSGGAEPEGAEFWGAELGGCGAWGY